MPVVRVAAGSPLEMYDFQIFGYYAAAIAATCFPSGDEYASLMLFLATFGAGFLMRPLGAIVLGAYIDHRGRRSGLLLTLAFDGIWNSRCCVSARICGPRNRRATAGFGRTSGTEILRGRGARRCLGLSFRNRAAQSQGILRELAIGQPASGGDVRRATRHRTHIHALEQPNVALGMAGGTSRRMRSASIATVSAPIARRDRRVLARPRSASASDIVKTLFANWRLVVLGMMMSTMTTVCFYLFTAYTPTFGTSVLHLAAKGNLIVTLCVGACNFVVLPSDGAPS